MHCQRYVIQNSVICHFRPNPCGNLTHAEDPCLTAQLSTDDCMGQLMNSTEYKLRFPCHVPCLAYVSVIGGSRLHASEKLLELTYL